MFDQLDTALNKLLDQPALNLVPSELYADDTIGPSSNTVAKSGIEENTHIFDGSTTFGAKGEYYVSPADKKATEDSSGDSIAIDREMCEHCREWFEGRAYISRELGLSLIRGQFMSFCQMAVSTGFLMF